MLRDYIKRTKDGFVCGWVPPVTMRTSNHLSLWQVACVVKLQNSTFPLNDEESYGMNSATIALVHTQISMPRVLLIF